MKEKVSKVKDKKTSKNLSKNKETTNGKKYDERNKLNDLNGAEWKFSTKTVISKIYPSNIQHKLRAQHGGQKPPELCKDLIKIFTKKGQLVLDPLAGVGGTLLGAALCGREALGIEINKKWIDIYEQVCDLENLKKFTIFNGDAKDILPKIEKESVDFILTDVPYWIMDKLEHTRSKKADRVSNLSIFNNEALPTKDEWLEDMKEIFEKAVNVLKQNGYMAVFIGDLYRGKEYHFLSADLARTICGIPSLIMKSDIIWNDDSKMLHIYGYPFAYIPSLIHQHILIFRKEER